MFKQKEEIKCIQCSKVLGYTLFQDNDAYLHFCENCLKDCKRAVKDDYNEILEEFTQKKLEKKKRKINNL